jgi:hypothetical protein
MAINWQEIIIKENNPEIITRKDLFEKVFAKVGSYQKMADRWGITKIPIQTAIEEEEKLCGYELEVNYFICNVCGDKVKRKAGQGRKATCDKPECQTELKKIQTQGNKERSFRRGQKRRKKREEFQAIKKPKPTVRICKKCGGNPYPNYRYCPPCHSYVTQNMSGGMDDAYMC